MPDIVPETLGHAADLLLDGRVGDSAVIVEHTLHIGDRYRAREYDGADVTKDEVAEMERVCILFDGNDPKSLQRAREQWKELAEAGCAAQYWAQEGTRPVAASTLSTMPAAPASDPRPGKFSSNSLGSMTVTETPGSLLNSSTTIERALLVYEPGRLVPSRQVMAIPCWVLIGRSFSDVRRLVSSRISTTPAHFPFESSNDRVPTLSVFERKPEKRRLSTPLR